MEFVIPNKYQVGGQEITIDYVDNIKNAEALGSCSVTEGKIQIAEKSWGQVQSKDSKLNTFFHELVHSILSTMGETELNENEKFVHCFSSFLTEAIKTSRL